MTASKLQQMFYEIVAEPAILMVASAPTFADGATAMSSSASNPICITQCNTFRAESVSFDEVVVNPYQRSVAHHLGSIPGIEAVFAITDDKGVVHIYSVAVDLEDRVYDKLFMREPLVKKDHPETSFEFHLRAHQGRRLDAVVPLGSEPLFIR